MTSTAFGDSVRKPVAVAVAVAMAYLTRDAITSIEGTTIGLEFAGKRFAGAISLHYAFDPKGMRLKFRHRPAFARAISTGFDYPIGSKTSAHCPQMPKDILIISRNFPPITGGMEKLMWNTYLALGAEYRVTLIGPKGSAAFVNSPHQCVECDEASPAKFLIQASIAALRLTLSRRFVFACGGSGLVGPVGRLLQLTRRIPFIVFLHGLDIIADNLIYQGLFIPTLRNADRIITNSQNTTHLAHQAHMDPSKTVIVHPGTDLDFSYAKRVDLNTRYGLVGKRLILSVGRLIKRKGVLEFIDRSLPAIVTAHPDVVFVVIGDEPTQALKQDDPATISIQSVIEKHALEDHVLMLGRVDDDVLFSAYELAQLHIFPIMDLPGDVEGFGIVAVEAAAFGLPTIAFNAGGVSDAILDNKTGRLVEAGDYTAMVNVVNEALSSNLRAKMRDQCLAHSQSMTWSRFGEQVLSHCKAVVSRSRN